MSQMPYICCLAMTVYWFFVRYSLAHTHKNRCIIYWKDKNGTRMKYTPTCTVSLFSLPWDLLWNVTNITRNNHSRNTVRYIMLKIFLHDNHWNIRKEPPSAHVEMEPACQYWADVWLLSNAIQITQNSEIFICWFSFKIWLTQARTMSMRQVCSAICKGCARSDW